MSEPIYERVWDAFTEHLHQRHYDHSSDPAAPTPEAHSMSIIDTIEADYEEVRATLETARTKAEAFATDKLTPVLEDAKKLASNPVAAALLRAVHVPPEALTMAVSVIDGLEELYKPETASQAPAEVAAPADPVMGQPVAVPAQ